MSNSLRPASVSGHVVLIPSRREGLPGTWYAKWRDTDGQHRRRLGQDWVHGGLPAAGFLRRREAEAELAEILVEARRHAKAVFDGKVQLAVERAGGATFAEVAAAWLNWAGGEAPWKPATRRNYASMLRPNRRLMTAFGSRPLRLIDRAEVRAWWDALRRELSPRNANAHLTVFRAMVNWADRSDEFGPVTDPSRSIRKFREPTSDKPAFFEPEDVLAIVRAAEELHREMAADPERRERAFASRHDADVFLVAAFTGMRRGEVVSLRWREVSFEQATIHIRESVSATETSTPKSGHGRTIPMVPQVAERLARLAPVDARDSSVLVFPGAGKNGKLDGDALSKRFLAARDRAGVTRTKMRAGKEVPLSFHDLRHTFASLLARDPGIAWTEIQQAAGHASFRTTQRYLHHRPRHEDAQRFGRAFALESIARAADALPAIGA